MLAFSLLHLSIRGHQRDIVIERSESDYIHYYRCYDNCIVKLSECNHVDSNHICPHQL